MRSILAALLALSACDADTLHVWAEDDYMGHVYAAGDALGVDVVHVEPPPVGTINIDFRDGPDEDGRCFDGSWDVPCNPRIWSCADAESVELALLEAADGDVHGLALELDVCRSFAGL